MTRTYTESMVAIFNDAQEVSKETFEFLSPEAKTMRKDDKITELLNNVKIYTIAGATTALLFPMQTTLILCLATGFLAKDCESKFHSDKYYKNEASEDFQTNAMAILEIEGREDDATSIGIIQECALAIKEGVEINDNFVQQTQKKLGINLL